jgi:hypothetical protein
MTTRHLRVPNTTNTVIISLVYQTYLSRSREMRSIFFFFQQVVHHIQVAGVNDDWQAGPLIGSPFHVIT